jgi:hypothetical protein
MNHLVDLVGGDWNMAIIFHIYHILGMSSSQLTFPPFFRGEAKNHQPERWCTAMEFGGPRDGRCVLSRQTRSF